MNQFDEVTSEPAPNGKQHKGVQRTDDLLAYTPPLVPVYGEQAISSINNDLSVNLRMGGNDALMDDLNGRSIRVHEHKRVQRFTPQQKLILDHWFQERYSNPYPGREDLEILEVRTGLTRRQIQVYFTNKRSRTRFS